MLRAPVYLSLRRRLISQYLMYALAGLFTCVGAVIALALHGTLLELTAIVIIAPLLCLGVGAIALDRTVYLNAAIAEQLEQITSDLSRLNETLQPLPESAPLARGWNALIREVRDQRILSALDSRLSLSFGAVHQQRWEAIFDSLPDGVAISDAEGKLTQLNNSLQVLLNVPSPAEVIGQPLLELLRAQFPAESHAALATLGDGSGCQACDLKRGVEWAAGAWRVTRLSLVGEAGQPGETLWTVRDITQQKLAEEMRNQFVFTATHELRTPLANIKAYAETLSMQDEIDVERQKGFYNIINAEATRLGRFVDDLLNVSQMEAGSIGIVRHEADVERLLLEITEHVRPQAEQKQLKLDTKFPPKLPKLRVDKDKFSAALVNLLGNAVKYTPDGGQVKFTVEVTASAIAFVVEDSGIGIAPDELPRLCEKFFRSGDSRVRAINGSGLGLAFTQEVARLHGGKLNVVSELNKGSRFTLNLPLQGTGG